MSCGVPSQGYHQTQPADRQRKRFGEHFSSCAGAGLKARKVLPGTGFRLSHLYRITIQRLDTDPELGSGLIVGGIGKGLRVGREVAPMDRLVGLRPRGSFIGILAVQSWFDACLAHRTTNSQLQKAPIQNTKYSSGELSGTKLGEPLFLNQTSTVFGKTCVSVSGWSVV